MYLTAHLVQHEGIEGINAFLHLHGKSFPWPDDPEQLPNEDPGRVAAKRVDLIPGGNSVRAYFDLLTPDGTPIEQLHEAARRFEADLPERRNPTVFTHQRVTIRFGVEMGLERLRLDQFLLLSRAAWELMATYRKRP